MDVATIRNLIGSTFVYFGDCDSTNVPILNIYYADIVTEADIERGMHLSSPVYYLPKSTMGPRYSRDYGYVPDHRIYRRNTFNLDKEIWEM